MHPTVSVIIPTYNRAGFLQETVDSVLAQTYADFEVLIIDDGSTDQTRDVVAKLNGSIRYFFQENQGRSVARNVGIDQALGKYLLFLDSDDLLLPDSLATLVGVLDARPDVGVVYSDGVYCTHDGRDLGRIDSHRPVVDETLEDGFLQFQALCNVVFVNHSALVRRVWVDRIGPEYFDSTLSAAEDADFWFRVAVAGCTFRRIPDVTCKYRLHAGNTYLGTLPSHERYRQSLLRGRLKVFYSDTFLKLWPKTQKDFLYGLLMDPVFGDADLQPEILASARFGQLPTAIQAQILYLSAIDRLVAGGEVTDLCPWLKRAARLQPRRSKYHIALWLTRFAAPIFILLLRAQRRRQRRTLPVSSQVSHVPAGIAT